MHTTWLWLGFNLFVLLALALDLSVFHRKAHKIKLPEAAYLSAAWIALAVLFGLGVWHWIGEQRGLEYFTGYLIEKALSVDNLFVFLVIFRAYRVDDRVQHRVLAWGILGALLMRGAMIAAGAALIAQFHWILAVFGVFLIYTGAAMFRKKEKKPEYEKNFIVRWASRHLRVTQDYQGHRFFLRREGRRFATPLFLVLLIVEITDVTFALDSIPAVFGITRDPFIVYTSNVFAILGLRALYFLLADVLEYFRYLGIGLAMVLMFIGGKMILDLWLPVPVLTSLAIIAAILAASVIVSLRTRGKKRRQDPEEQLGR